MYNIPKGELLQFSCDCPIVDKPESTFRLRNPYIVDFGQVKSVSADKGPAEGIYITIRTSHPFAGDINFMAGSTRDAEEIRRIIGK